MITGKLPPSFEATSEGPPGSWHSIPALLASKSKPKPAGGGSSGGGSASGGAASDPELEAALRASLAETDADSDRRMGYETSGASGGFGAAGGQAAMQGGADDDDELQMALAMSLSAGGAGESGVG